MDRVVTWPVRLTRGEGLFTQSGRSMLFYFLCFRGVSGCHWRSKTRLTPMVCSPTALWTLVELGWDKVRRLWEAQARIFACPSPRHGEVMKEPLQPTVPGLHGVCEEAVDFGGMSVGLRAAQQGDLQADFPHPVPQRTYSSVLTAGSARKS